MPAPTLLAAALAAVGVFMLFHALIRPASRRARLAGRLDYSSAAKGYRTYVPLGGGPALFWAWLLGVAGIQLSGFWTDATIGVLTGALIAHLVGLRDDMLRLGSLTRNSGLALAALCTVLLSGGHLLVPVAIDGSIQAAAAMAVAAGAVPLFLSMKLNRHQDCADGLLGLTVITILAWLGIAAATIGQPASLVAVAVHGWPLAAAMAAFLVYNLRRPGHPRARVYMGSSGNAVAGLLMGAIALQFALSQAQVAKAALFLAWLFALPAFDGLGVLWRRFRNRGAVREADPRRLQSLMQGAGLSEGAAVVVQSVLLFALGGVGYACWLLAVSPAAQAGLLLGLALLVAAVSRWAWSRRLAAPSVLVISGTD